MEGNLSSGGLMPSGSSYGALDLQESMRINHHHQHPLSLQQQHHSQSQQGSIPMNDGFPINMGQIHNCDQSNSVADFNKVDKGKNSVSDEDEPTFNEDGIDGLNDHAKGKKVSFWQRVKWTDSMVRLLITAVSYIGEDAASECGLGGRRKYANLQKKGKWKSVSKVMAERGFYVSPQQCEDKFNDLNKRYKKLNDILGRGTSCQVVENPALLDMMDNLSEKTKDERSLQLALRSRDDHETSDSRRHQHDDIDEDDHDAETDDHEEYEDNHNKGTYVITGDDSAKRIKQGQGHESFNFGNHMNSQDLNKNIHLQPNDSPSDMNLTFSDSFQKQLIKSRSVELEQQKLQIDLEMLELEKQRFKWQRFSRKKDRELEKLKLENEKMKLENDRMALELRRMEMSMHFNQ